MKKNITIRLRFVELYESGQRISDIARELNKDSKYITRLKQQYLVLGQEEFLKDKNGRKVSGKLKQQIVSEYQKKTVSLNFLALKYKVANTAVLKWVRKAQKDGIETLVTSNYGRQKNMAKQRQVNEPEVLKENEQLKKELEYLRLENAYLKKLRALVEEERANFIKNALGSSKN